MFEKRNEQLLSGRNFAKRLAICLTCSLLMIGVSLLIGIGGYCLFEQMSFLDAFHQASLLYCGVGGFSGAMTNSGKLFEGIFAIYSAVALFFPITILLAPIIHRFMHKFHLGK